MKEGNINIDNTGIGESTKQLSNVSDFQIVLSVKKETVTNIDDLKLKVLKNKFKGEK